MPFNTALSGIRAANTDLKVTGNNIANASTTGFKSSRAEFGDVYASSLLGGGSNSPGSGVNLQMIRQQFSQGNPNFTGNNLDLAVNGAGFFVVSNEGDQLYTRAGAFGLNKDGYIVSNTGGNLQGYMADDSGNVSGILGDLQVDVSTQPPRQTTGVEAQFNLNANASVLESIGTRFVTDSAVVGVAQPAVDTVNANNGYAAQTITFEGPEGSLVDYNSEEYASAAQIASELNSLAGISASARTVATIQETPFDNSSGALTLNNAPLSSVTLEELADEINETLPGITAEINGDGDLVVTSLVGMDLTFGFDGTIGTDEINVNGELLNVNGESIVVGGEISILMEEGYSVVAAGADDPTEDSLFEPLTPLSFTEVAINSFNPDDQATYNHATSGKVFDSLGNPHIMTQYFVKQPFNPLDPSTSANHWEMHVLIDGQEVGDPDPTLPPPENTLPTRATFNVYFNNDGSFNESLSDSMLVSNWVPRDENGDQIGGLGPQNVLQGGQLPVVEPPSSSNFEISLSGSTQFGAPFAVEDLNQNGYTTGRLAGLDIGDDGTIFARFTNGEAQVLGQVALANFNNVEALKPVGDTMWAQTSGTGEAVIGTPGSASLGSLNAGALEESNVDLSTQLVNLIIAQRNFQASAKTIETANQTTQTIINLR